MRVVIRAWTASLLGFALVAVPAFAADESPTKQPPPKAPDWSGYSFVSDVVGEVVKAEDKAITLRVTWFEPQGNGGKNGNGRPRLSQNPRNFRNPYRPNMNRPSQPKAQLKEHHHDYVLEYVPESLVRFKSLPPKFDDTGKRAQYTQKELDELRQPPGVSGYAASKADLAPGTIVELILIRDKSIPASKATEDDLRIKYAFVMGKDPNPPKDIGAANKNDNKKKKN